MKLLLANALILPLIDYVCPTYCDVSQFLDSKINKMLNSTLRFVYGLKRHQHITPFRKKAHWLNSYLRRIYLCLTTFFHILFTEKPSYLYKLFPETEDGPRRSARNATNLLPLLPIPNCVPLSKSFVFFSIQKFNLLPNYIKNSPSVNAFKSRLFDFLHSNQGALLFQPNINPAI